MNINKILVGALRECETREQVEDTFSKFSVSDFAEKTQYLIVSMGNPEVFYSSEPDAESAYLTNLSAFLTGTWKLYAGGLLTK
jgi:hypothetical protein